MNKTKPTRTKRLPKKLVDTNVFDSQIERETLRALEQAVSALRMNESIMNHVADNLSASEGELALALRDVTASNSPILTELEDLIQRANDLAR